ncbi:hypothetical protein BC827DRAFT_1240949 [Russula dissimulans]|nr:hypothetical protein BC827DRAFT_1240949 [Russula dissimulans]
MSVVAQGVTLAQIQVRHLFLIYGLNIVPLVILFYDYALTLSCEVEYFWPHQNRVGWVPCIFLFTRYFSVLGHVPILIVLVPGPGISIWHAQFCNTMRQYNGYFGMVLQSLVSVLCATRVYALYNKSHYVILGLLALIITSAAIGMVAMATESGDSPVSLPYSVVRGWIFYLALSDEGGRFLSIAWSGVLAFDIIVFALTVYKAIKVGYKVPLIRGLVRDGSLYFFVLSSINLANILILQYAPTLLKNSGTPLTNVLSTTLVSRMMLRMRSDGIQHQSLEKSLGSTLTRLSELTTTTREYTPEECFELERPSKTVP